MIVGKLMVVLGLDSKGFNTGISSATGKTTAFAKVTDKTFKAISKSAKLGLLAVSAAFIKGTIDAAKFEKALASVSTMLDKTTMPMMEEFKKGILELAESYGESTDALAKGLYDILSASIPAAKAMDVLKVSAMAAKAGLTDTGVAADAITTLMNSFGDATKDAAYYSDIMFSTVKFGKTTFAELAPVIGNVAKLMQVAGGSAEDMAGMLAIMTRNGINTRVAVTSLRGVVSALIKPSEALTAELGGMTVEADGFRAVMDKIGSLPATDLAEMFPNVRALTGVVVAAKDLGSEVDKIKNLMEEGSPTFVAFEKQTFTMAEIWNRFKATLKATSITIGDELLPTMKEIFIGLTGWLKDNRKEFATFAKATVEGIKNIVITVFKLKEIIMGIGGAILSLMIVQKVTTAMAAFGIATSVALGPVAAIGAAVTLLVVGFLKLKKELKEEREEQELLNAAMDGSLETTEEYNNALDIQRGKLQEIIDAHEANIARLKNSNMVTEQQMDITKQAYYSNIRLEQEKIDLIVANAAEQKKLEDEEKKRLEEMSQAELQAHMDKQIQMADALAAEQEASALRKAKEAEIKMIRDALIAASETDEEKYNREKERLEELGLSRQEILDYLAIQYPEALEVAGEASINYFNAEDRRIGNWNTKITGAAETFKEKFTKAVNDIKKIFTQMYAALTGVTNQYFANLFSKLDNESASRKKKVRETITDEDELAAALEAIDKDIAKKKYDLELKQFKINKAMNIAQAIMNTAVGVSKALDAGPILGPIMAVIIGGLGAVQIGMIASQKAPAAPSFIRGGAVDNLVNSGVFSGKPGIDTNTINVTSGEYIMPPQQTADNIEELEAMRTGSGGKSITVNPMALNIDMDGRNVFNGVVEFMTEESDRGTFRINPKVIGALT